MKWYTVSMPGKRQTVAEQHKLAAIKAARVRLRNAQAQLEALIREADQERIPRVRIGRAAGMGRTSLYRLLDQGEE